MPATAELVFHEVDSTTLWKDAMVEVGRRQVSVGGANPIHS